MLNAEKHLDQLSQAIKKTDVCGYPPDLVLNQFKVLGHKSTNSQTILKVGCGLTLSFEYVLVTYVHHILITPLFFTFYFLMICVLTPQN